MVGVLTTILYDTATINCNIQQIRTKGSSRAESHMAAMRASSRSLLLGSTSNSPHQTIITKSTASRNSNMLCIPHLPVGRESKLPNAHTSAMSLQQQQHGATATGATGNSSSSMHDMIASSSGTLAGYHAGRTGTGTVNTGTANGTARFSRSATTSSGNNNDSSSNNKSSATLTLAGTDNVTQVTGGNGSTFVTSTTGSTTTASTSSSPVCVLFLHIVAEVMHQSTYIDVTHHTSNNNSTVTAVKSDQLFIPQPCPYVPETASNDAITAAVYDSTSNMNIDLNEGLKAAAQEPEFAVAARDVLSQLLRDAIACDVVKQSISTARATAVAAPYTPVFEDIIAGKQSIVKRFAAVLHIGTTTPTISSFKQALCDSTLSTETKDCDETSTTNNTTTANVYTALLQAINDAENSNSTVLQLNSVLAKLSRSVTVVLDTWLNEQEHLQYIAQRETAIATAKIGKSYGNNSSDITTAATTTAAAAAAAIADTSSDVVGDSQQLHLDEIGASKAATAIQAAQRAKQARAQVAHKRHLASPRGKSETLAATAIQSHARRMAAAKHTAHLQQSALEVGVQTAVQDPAVQCMVATALENTLFNLFEEALRGDFDVRAKPCRTVVKPAVVQQ
jgi:hypothetical protein